MDQIAIRMDALGPIDLAPVIAAIAYAHLKDGRVVEVKHIAITLVGQAPVGDSLETVIHQIETLCKTTGANVFMTREARQALDYRIESQDPQDLHEIMNAIGLGNYIVFNHDLDCRLAVEADAATLCGLHSLKESHGNNA